MSDAKELPTRRGHLLTEQSNPASLELDRGDVSAGFDIINRQDERIAEAVARAKPEICRAIELIADRLRRGEADVFEILRAKQEERGVHATHPPPTGRTH